MLKAINILALVIYVVTLLVTTATVRAEIAIQPSLIFTEVKVRHDTANIVVHDEFIELYNATSIPLVLSNYVIEYFNTTNPTDSQLPTQKSFSNLVLASGGQVVLAKQPSMITNSLQSPLSSLSDTGGRLRLVTIGGDIIDEIAWANSQASVSTTYPSIIYQCNTSNALCSANRTQSFSRQIDSSLEYVLIAATWSLGLTTPLSSQLLPVVDETSEDAAEETPSATEVPLPATIETCEGIVISELLPNAAGSDTHKEFIELHNPTSAEISLQNCALQISSSTKTYPLTDIVLQPGSYFVLSDKVTGLTLPNASGGTVWLLSAADELGSVTYPGDLYEDEAWANISQQWQQTYSPTPGSENIAQPLKPCSTGQQRNTTTNECEKVIVTAVADLTPCKAGQERSASTNRCRNIITAAAALVSCRVGQERNPETNRCRSISASDTLQSCEEGQERNPETNRCRKVSSAGPETLAAVTDVKSPTQTSGSKLWLALVAVVVALGYAVYEWRQDILKVANRLLAKTH